jgi:hypothetical protein
MTLPFHCDESELVGLMCLQNGISGGLSAVANWVLIHNSSFGSGRQPPAPELRATGRPSTGRSDPNDIGGAVLSLAVERG